VGGSGRLKRGKRIQKKTMQIIIKEHIMKLIKILFVVCMLLFFSSSVGAAGDFDWIKGFNIQAEGDPSGFRARLAARFQIGNTQIDTVLSNVEKPADAYIALRLGEISRQPMDYVIEQYKSNKGKGWGALAKSLGIKPGSREFHALKQGHDLYAESGKDQAKGKKGKGKK
jgi:hypothetical protein